MSFTSAMESAPHTDSHTASCLMAAFLLSTSDFDAAWGSERGQRLMKALDEMMNPPTPPDAVPEDDANLD